MMEKNITLYTFKVVDFTPEDMPFGRLLEYYAEIAKMIGLSENMHLINVVEGSHASQFAIDNNHETEFAKRLTELNEGRAPRKAMTAYDTINAMLKEDSTSGQFSDPSNDNIIIFPGTTTADELQISVRDTATFNGKLYYIVGTPSDAKIRIKTKNYGVVFCKTTIEIAKALRDFWNEEVRVSGRGMWQKSADGTWVIDDFTITDFMPVQQESLSDAVKRLRKIDVDWPDDPIGRIAEFEGKKEHIQ